MVSAAISILWQIATSRVGAALIAGAISWQVAYWRGHDAADQSAKVAALESRIAVKEADLTAARNAERIARDQAAQLADISLQQQEYLDDLESSLAARTDRDACRVTDADAERLRRVDAGESGAAARPAPLSILPPARDRAGAAGR